MSIKNWWREKTWDDVAKEIYKQYYADDKATLRVDGYRGGGIYVTINLTADGKEIEYSVSSSCVYMEVTEANGKACTANYRGNFGGFVSHFNRVYDGKRRARDIANRINANNKFLNIMKNGCS